MLILQRYAFDDHVTSDAASSTSPAWRRMGSVVLSWIFGTITIELQDIVRKRGSTAHQAWLAIEEQFLGNRETRALHLDAVFRTFVQGDLDVNDYCRKMKGMADALTDLGETVPDRTLVLNLLRGMNKRYDHLKTFLKRAKPFPSFHAVRNDLFLEELNMGAEAQHDTTTAFSSTGTSGGH